MRREAARKALDEGGVSVATLPTDMQTALAQGRLTAADARAWVGISQNALLCKLATAMPCAPPPPPYLSAPLVLARFRAGLTTSAAERRAGRPFLRGVLGSAGGLTRPAEWW
jgi:D-alanyl-D-alanine dipeptidase